ncbi:MAG: T9SS type A sorting domain-containing protein [Saprospiraceae bacterium]|nr:T9SS type A sorting domain-containing protein [Saprospiraceae bacterium]
MRKFTHFFFIVGILNFSFLTTVNAQCGAGQTYNNYCYGRGETNHVAFEFCPSAGMIAQSNIIQGNFVIPPNTLTVYQGTSGSGITGTVVFGPATADVSGNTITATVADACLIFVTNTLLRQTLTCNDGFVGASELRVCSQSNSDPSTATLILSADEFCETDGPQTIGGGLPIGGVYSGTGVTDNGNGTTFTFEPSIAGAGTTSITYTQAGNVATDVITVVGSNVASFTALADLCMDAGIQSGLGGGTPTGGVYSGLGVTDDGNGMTYSFNPAIAGLGITDITYTLNTDCTPATTDQVEILPACGCPAMQSNFFYCFGNNETDIVTFEVCPSAGMAAQATITGGTLGTFVSDGDVLNVYSGASGSGSSGTLIGNALNGDLSGNILSSGIADDCLIFIVSTGPVGSCQDGHENPLSVCGQSVTPNITFLNPGDFCETDGIQSNLGGGLPMGGVYSGPGVTDDGNGMTFSFDPAAAGTGTHILTYTKDNDSDNVTIEVFEANFPSFTALPDLCIDAGIQSGLGGGSPANGTYAGPGVTDNGDGTYDFNPAIAGLGIHTITYTTKTGCMDSAFDTVEVLAACGCPSGQQVFFHCQDNLESNLVLFEICPVNSSMAVQATITQGTYGTYVSDNDAITVYSGVTGTGVNGNQVYNGSNTNFAGTVITSLNADGCLTFVSNTGPVGSCVTGEEVPLTICATDVPPPTNFTAPADLCLNEGVQSGLNGGTPTGGVYSGSGVTDDGNGLTYSFDPTAAGVGIHPIIYSVNGDPATDDIEVFALPAVTLALSEAFCENDGIQTGLGGGMPTGGIYSGTSVTDDGNGMTFSFDPSTGPDGYQITYTFTDANGCTNSSSTLGVIVNEVPSVTFTAPADICENDGVQNGLGGGIPTGGTYAGPGVTDDGNGSTYSFDPAAAGAGIQNISYSFTNGSGCSDTASDDLVVLGAPAVSIQPYNGLPFDEVCLNSSSTYRSSASTFGPPTVTTYTWAASNTTFTPNIGSPTAQDGTYERVDASWTTPGSQTVDLTVTYANGCVQVAPQLAVDVQPAPAIICPTSQTVQTSNNGNGDCTADATFTNPIDLNGACDPQTLTLSVNGGIASTVIPGASNTQSLDLGVNTLSYVITDGGGNMGNCSFNITVEDDEAPVIDCTSASIEFDGEDTLTFSIADVYNDASSTDNCGVVNLISPIIDQTVSCDQLGDVIPVTVEVNDGNGNSTTCTTNITIGGLPCGFSNSYGLGDCFDPNGNEANYDVPTGTFSLISDGCSPEFPYTSDDQSFIKYELCGNGVIEAYVRKIDGDGYAGIAMRESIDPGARKVGIATNRINRILKEIRVFPNYPAFPQQLFSYDKFWLKLERLNNTFFRAYASTNGINYTPFISQGIQMTGCLEIGLYVYSNNDGQTVKAEFTNVSIIPSTGNLNEGDFPYETGVKPISGLDIGLSPNPAKDRINLDLSKLIGQEARIQIYNIHGQLIEERQIDAIEEANENFDIESYPSGTYLINIQLAMQQQTLKLIKQ